MGGSGSGRRWHYGAKSLTDEYKSLDVRRWQRENLLEPGRMFSTQWSRNGVSFSSISVQTQPDSVTLMYSYRSQGGDSKWEQYPVRIEWTRCTYGGRRAWFLCPGLGCGRRVAILYGGRVFACRHCYKLAYRSQREEFDDRAARRLEKIRYRLGWQPGFLNGPGGKPKGMHLLTFLRLIRTHEFFTKRAVSKWLSMRRYRT